MLLGVRRGHPVAAAHLAQGDEQLVAVDPEPVGQRQQEVLDRQVLVAHVAREAVGRLEHVAGLTGQASAPAARTALGRRASSSATSAGAVPARPPAAQQGDGDALGLPQQRRPGGAPGVTSALSAARARSEAAANASRVLTVQRSGSMAIGRSPPSRGVRPVPVGRPGTWLQTGTRSRR